MGALASFRLGDNGARKRSALSEKRVLFHGSAKGASDDLLKPARVHSGKPSVHQYVEVGPEIIEGSAHPSPFRRWRILPMTSSRYLISASSWGERTLLFTR